MFDLALFREFQNLEDSVARELGQLVEKHEMGGMTDADGNPTGAAIQIVVTPDEAKC
jgi:hypothetical protein